METVNIVVRRYTNYLLISIYEGKCNLGLFFTMKQEQRFYIPQPWHILVKVIQGIYEVSRSIK